nr:zinc finger BED domain-containing protein RICESLEEPER 2-like [Tanacetum cinerariifolium]
MDMDGEMRQGDDTTQVDGNQSVNGSQGDESQDQPFQEEDTNLIGNKRKLTSDEAVGVGQVTYVNTSPRDDSGEKCKSNRNHYGHVDIKQSEKRYELNKWRHGEDEVIRDMAEQMILKFDKYWLDIHGFMGVTAVLDPRTKLKTMKFLFPKLYHSKQRAEKEFTKLKKFVSALFIEYDQAGKENVRNHVNGVGSTSHINESDGGFLSGYSKFIEKEDDETSDITSEVPEELDHYLKERVCNPNMKLDILVWWKINGLKYPTLQTIARDILAIPISTVASKSCFSTSGRLITPHCSRLKPNTLEALMCSQSWLVNEMQETCSKEFEAYDQIIEYDTDESRLKKWLDIFRDEELEQKLVTLVAKLMKIAERTG